MCFYYIFIFMVDSKNKKNAATGAQNEGEGESGVIPTFKDFFFKLRKCKEN